MATDDPASSSASFARDSRIIQSLPADPTQTERKEIESFFAIMAKFNASDLHLKVGSPPILRISGELRHLQSPPLTTEQIRGMVAEILSQDQRTALEGSSDLDFSYSLSGVGRFRVNVFRQRGSLSLAARRVNMRIPSFEELNLSPSLKTIADYEQGLVILAGITGSGKSTTIASMVEHINASRRCHIVTIEDPIEYLYRDKRSFVNQREIGIDVPSFRHALKFVVRQDPDVIVIGEMRDAETIEAGLQAAETGHLVFGTIHASAAAQTVGRILDLFPADRERQIRESLRFNLRAVVCQKLLPGARGGVVPAQEIMIVNATVSKLIAEGLDKKLEEVIRGGGEQGMQDFDQSLLRLIQGGLVEREIGISASTSPERLSMNLKGIFLGEDKKILGR